MRISTYISVTDISIKEKRDILELFSLIDQERLMHMKMQVRSIPVYEIQDQLGLDIDDIYSSIGSMSNNDMLIALNRIVSYERDTYRLISYINRRGSINTDNLIIKEYLYQGGNIGDLSYEFHIGYSNVYSIDSLLSNQENREDLQVHIATLNDLYLGHVYTWKYQDILNVQGIRTSIRNSLLRIVGYGVKGVATHLIQYIASLTDNTIVVNLPLDSMINILERNGFNPDEYGNYTLH